MSLSHGASLASNQPSNFPEATAITGQRVHTLFVDFDRSSNRIQSVFIRGSSIRACPCELIVLELELVYSICGPWEGERRTVNHHFEPVTDYTAVYI